MKIIAILINLILAIYEAKCGGIVSLLSNRQAPKHLTHALRQQRTEDNHISINGQIYSVDGPNVNVGVEGHDLSVNGTVYQNRATEKHLQIIQDRNIRNVIVSVPLAFFSTENIIDGQINAKCNGNLYIDQSSDGCSRIICVDDKKNGVENNFRQTSDIFLTSDVNIFESANGIIYNSMMGGTLHIHNSSLECANIECDASLNINHSPIERNAKLKCGGSLSIDESPMGNIRIESGGSLNINKSQMESSQIDVGGSIGIVESPMGSIGIDCGGSLRIEKSKMEIGNLDCGGSSTIVGSPAQSLKLNCGGSLNMKESPMKNVRIDCGGSATIKKSQMESGRINCGGNFSIDRTPTGSVRIDYGGRRINL
uniref:Esophageal gland-localized secretory protein 7 n=1 Tax=Heterodera glycines TaxID=51029 RepID=A0A0E3JCP2_HETGL|nr:esophageal gland-localized secretory protein 7 [Heterodera glycines]